MNPAHLDYDVLADLAEGLLEDDEAASVNAHLDTCTECRERSADLADVSRILAQAPVPSMPAELAERIDTAIAAESLNSASVASLEQRRGRRHWRILSAAAAAVVVLGGGAAVGTVALDNASSDHGAAAAPPQDQARPSTADKGGMQPNSAPAPAFEVSHSGTDYRSGTLAAQAGKATPDDRQQQNLSAGPSPQLRECVLSVVGERKPVLVDQATYEGSPATVIAVRGDGADKLHVWVVAPDCSAENQHILKQING